MILVCWTCVVKKSRTTAPEIAIWRANMEHAIFDKPRQKINYVFDSMIFPKRGCLAQIYTKIQSKKITAVQTTRVAKNVTENLKLVEPIQTFGWTDKKTNTQFPLCIKAKQTLSNYAGGFLTCEKCIVWVACASVWKIRNEIVGANCGRKDPTPVVVSPRNGHSPWDGILKHSKKIAYNIGEKNIRWCVCFWKMVLKDN